MKVTRYDNEREMAFQFIRDSVRNYDLYSGFLAEVETCAIRTILHFYICNLFLSNIVSFLIGICCPWYKGGNTSDSSSKNQSVNIVRAFVRVYGLKVHDVTDNVIFIRNPICS